MNPPEFPRKEVQLQGPRPSPLRLNKDSHKIKKPPQPPPHAKPPLAPATHHRQPVIIYSVSPKVIHATVGNFMTIVQRLTGPSYSAGDVSPAARLASIEKTNPSERDRGVGDVMDMVEGLEVCQLPGILSPAPATLPPVPAGYFSPILDPNTTSFLQDLSPFWHGNSFMSSPSGLLSAPLVSPSPKIDLFNLLWDL